MLLGSLAKKIRVFQIFNFLSNSVLDYNNPSMLNATCRGNKFGAEMREVAGGL